MHLAASSNLTSEHVNEGDDVHDADKRQMVFYFMPLYFTAAVLFHLSCMGTSSLLLMHGWCMHDVGRGQVVLLDCLPTSQLLCALKCIVREF